MNSIKKMNKTLYNAAFHLTEAAQHLTNVEEFREEAVVLFKMADGMLAVIKVEDPKISEEKMNDILGEIMEFGDDKDGSA